MQPPSSQPSSNPWQTLNNSILLRFVLLFGCGWITVILLNYFYTTVALFTTAGFFAALLNYPVIWLSRHLPRWLAIMLTFLGAIALLMGLIALLGLQVLNQGQSLLRDLGTTLSQQELLPFQNILDQLEFDRILNTLQTGLSSGLAIAQQIFSSAFLLLFGFVICLYMVIDGEKLWQYSLRLVPVAARDKFSVLFKRTVVGFLRSQIIMMICFGIGTLVVLLVIGADYALLLAIVAGLVDAIPGIGAVLAVALVTLLVFFSHSLSTTVKVLIAMTILEQLQENYIRPRVTRDELEINPVLLFLSLFIGQRVAGILGVFLAVPIAGMIAAWMRKDPEPTDLPGAIADPPILPETIVDEPVEYSETP